MGTRPTFNNGGRFLNTAEKAAHPFNKKAPKKGLFKKFW
jgi:hypothetical protein